MKSAGLLVGTMLGMLVAAAPARAIPVTAMPDGTLVPIPILNASGPGPYVFGPSISWSTTSDYAARYAILGIGCCYGFGSNGSWTGALGAMAGLGSSTADFGVTSTMTFAFASPVAGVGGFLNHVPHSAHPTVIAIYDESDRLLESVDLTILTAGESNAGAFMGFLRDRADIKSFRLTDNYVGITRLTVQASPIPEPGTCLLVGVGLVGLASRSRVARGRGQ